MAKYPNPKLEWRYWGKKEGSEVEEGSNHEALIALLMNIWERSLSSTDKKIYRVKQLLDQSPAAWTIGAVAPQAWR